MPELSEVFLAYRHDSVAQQQAVLELADQLRSDGIAAHLDQYERWPREGWSRWLHTQLTGAAAVIVVCSAGLERVFSGKARHDEALGVHWEQVLVEYLSDPVLSGRCIPVTLGQAPDEAAQVPGVLQGRPLYRLPEAYPALVEALRAAGLSGTSPLPRRAAVASFLVSDSKRAARTPDTTVPAALLSGRYRVVRPLGEGGASKVFLATDAESGAQCIVKMPGVPDQATRVRFMREVETYVQVEHPALTRLLDFGTTPDEELYLILEFNGGETLATLLEQRRLTEQETAQLGHRLAQALGALHAEGLLHSDIKPSNIFVPHGELNQAKLGDLGLVTELRADTQLTRPGMVIGTPYYMSPEQVQGESLGPASDVWALGVVLYECAYGKLPFQGQTVADLLLAIMTVPVHCAPLANGLERVLAGALVKARAERTANMDAFVHSLQPVLAGRMDNGGLRQAPFAVAAQQSPVEVGVSGPVDEPVHGVRVERGSALVPSWLWLVAGLGSVVLATGIYFWSPAAERPSATEAPGRLRSVRPEPAQEGPGELEAQRSANGAAEGMSDLPVERPETGPQSPAAGSGESSALTEPKKNKTGVWLRYGLLVALSGLAAALFTRWVLSRAGAGKAEADAAADATPQVLERRAALVGQRVRGQEQLSKSMAMAVDQLLADFVGDPAIDLRKVSLAMAVQDYQLATTGTDRWAALDRALALVDRLQQETARREAPWYQVHKDLLTLGVAVVSAIAALISCIVDALK